MIVVCAHRDDVAEQARCADHPEFFAGLLAGGHSEQNGLQRKIRDIQGALAKFHRCGFTDTSFGPATRLTIRVKRPEIEHTVSVGKIQTWLDGSRKESK